jgi:hypothetical protein
MAVHRCGSSTLFLLAVVRAPGATTARARRGKRGKHVFITGILARKIALRYQTDLGGGNSRVYNRNFGQKNFSKVPD